MKNLWKGLYYEDFEIGERYVTPGRTLGEADIVNFSAFTGDWSPHHTDAVFAASTIYGERLAQGTLIVAVVSGLIVRSGIIGLTIMGLLESHYQYRAPVKIGDTIRAEVHIAEKRETKKADRGILRYNLAVLNQRDEIVLEGYWLLLMARRKDTEVAPAT